MADRRADLLLGVLYGDCLGAPYEFSTPDPSQPLTVGESIFGHPPGCGTDDTETTLAVVYGLLDAADQGVLDHPERSIADRLLEWFEGAPADVGNTTRRGLATYARTRDPLISGPDGPYSISNGSLMRSAPFVLAYPDPVNAAEIAARSSMVTHRHPMVLACVEAYVRLLAALLDGRPVAPEGAPAAVYDAYRAAVRVAERLPGDLPCPGIGHARYALSVAYWAAVSPLADSFEEGIEHVVRLGGDTDTNGAICGAVLAARHGFPGELVEHLGAQRVHEVAVAAAGLLRISR